MELAATMRIYGILGGVRSSFLYGGSFSDEHTARLIALVEALFCGRNVRKDRLNRLSFVAVEAYQNIIRHRVPDNGGLNDGRLAMFLLQCGDHNDHVTAINAVRNAETAPLEDTLSHLRGLDGRQLKALFLKGLQDQATRRRGGAGLGLIEMARRSGNDLRHDMRRLDDQRDLFLLDVSLGDDRPAHHDLREAWALYDTVIEHRLLMAHAGLIGPTAQEVFLRILEQETGSQAARASGAYLAAVEQFNRPDGGPRDGMVAVIKAGGQHGLILLRSVPQQEARHALALGDELATLEGSALQRRYREALIAQTQGTVRHDVPMLDLARHASGRLTWHTEPRPGNMSWVAVHVPL